MLVRGVHTTAHTLGCSSLQEGPLTQAFLSLRGLASLLLLADESGIAELCRAACVSERTMHQLMSGSHSGSRRLHTTVRLVQVDPVHVLVLLSPSLHGLAAGTKQPGMGQPAS